MSEHTPLPWALLQYFPTKIVPASQVEKALGGSMYEDEDRERFATVIAAAESNEFTGFAHEIAPDIQKANAAFIVKAVNSHDALLALAKAYEQWEADIILENKCWTGQNVRLTDELYERMIQLQTERNRVLALVGSLPEGKP